VFLDLSTIHMDNTIRVSHSRTFRGEYGRRGKNLFKIGTKCLFLSHKGADDLKFFLFQSVHRRGVVKMIYSIHKILHEHGLSPKPVSVIDSRISVPKCMRPTAKKNKSGYPKVFVHGHRVYGVRFEKIRLFNEESENEFDHFVENLRSVCKKHGIFRHGTIKNVIEEACKMKNVRLSDKGYVLIDVDTGWHIGRPQTKGKK